MAKTIDISGAPMGAFQYLLVGSLVFGLLVIVAFAARTGAAALGVAVPRPNGVVWPAAFAVVWVTVTVMWGRHIRGADDNRWVSVPREQFLGRFVDHGVLARANWAQPIRHLSEDAETDERRDAGDDAERDDRRDAEDDAERERVGRRERAE